MGSCGSCDNYRVRYIVDHGSARYSARILTCIRTFCTNWSWDEARQVQRAESAETRSTDTGRVGAAAVERQAVI